MKRALILFCIVLLQPAAFAQAAPLQQDCRSVALSSPASGDAVRGRITIAGSAAIPQFQFFKVELAAGASAPDSAYRNLSADVHRSAVQSGALELWDTTAVPDGTYSLRLTVVDIRGNFPCPPPVVRVVVSNRVAASTPTSEATATETPTIAATGSPSPRATNATTQPSAPTVDVPTSAARGTAITNTVALSTTTGSSGASRQLIDLNLLPAFGQACALGGITMGAIFALFGVFTLARWVLDKL